VPTGKSTWQQLLLRRNRHCRSSCCWSRASLARARRPWQGVSCCFGLSSGRGVHAVQLGVWVCSVQTAAAFRPPPPLTLWIRHHHPAHRLLARRLQWPLIDKDDSRDCLEPFAAVAAAAAEASQPLSVQTHEPRAAQQAPVIDWNGLSYGIMFRYAATQLALGINTIIDCPFSRVELFHRAQQLAQKVGDVCCFVCLGVHVCVRACVRVTAYCALCASAGGSFGVTHGWITPVNPPYTPCSTKPPWS